MHVDDLRGPSRSQGGSRGDPSTSSLVSALQKRMPSIPVKHGAVDTQGSQFLHYMDTIIQLARESADSGGDPEGGLYLAKALKYIEQNPRIPLQDVPHLSRTRGAEGDSPDWIMYRVLQPGLRDIWADIPVDIKDSCSVIELFQFFVSLKPRNPKEELKGLRDKVMDAGTADAEIKPVRDIKYLVDTMRILSRAITHYESRSGTTATEHTYAARLIDVMVRIYAPISSKPGSKGGTLSQALSSRSILKQMQEKDDQLTWKEIMDTCIRFGEENAGQHTVTSMLANSDNADKAGKGGGKGVRATRTRQTRRTRVANGVRGVATNSPLPMALPQACVFITSLRARVTSSRLSVRSI